MENLFILTDEQSEFLVSKADLENYTSMDIGKIRDFFISRNFNVKVCKFSELDLNENYKGVYFLYQSSEAPGSFYKRYIENLIYFLEKQGALPLPKFEYLKAHHDKASMELLRMSFKDNSLKNVQSLCYGSWVDARNYRAGFPVVIKAVSSSASAGVYLAKNKTDYDKLVKQAGKILIGQSPLDLLINHFKKVVKKIIKLLDKSKEKYYWSLNTTPVSTPLVVQTFIEDLKGDYKILVYGGKYYLLFRKNRENDFRASGSGKFYDVPEEEHEALLTFAYKLTTEIDFPVLGMDVAYNGKEYFLIEFQMIDLGPITMQRSTFWYEFHDGKWIRFYGKSDLEEEFSRAIHDFIELNHR
jgi:glutathione synthase/RimK-type ligase-like ATP-grasp enzyme